MSKRHEFGEMLLDVKPETSVFVSGFDHTLHSFYTVPDCTCAPYDAVFAGTLACESVARLGRRHHGFEDDPLLRGILLQSHI